MKRSVRPVPQESAFDAQRKARVSELIVAYFIRGIRALDNTPRGKPLETRGAWSARPQLAAKPQLAATPYSTAGARPTARPQLSSSRRDHPWS